MSHPESAPDSATTTGAAQESHQDKEIEHGGDATSESPAADALERLRQRNVSTALAPEGSDPADALARLKRINESLRERGLPELPESAPQKESRAIVPAPQKGWRPSMPSSRIAKSLLALVAAGAIAWVPVRQLLATTSADATINARLVNLRAPIDGKVSILAPSIAVGTSVMPGEALLHIANARADRQRLDDMRRTLRNVQSEIAIKSKQLDRFEEIESNSKAQRDAFQMGRIRQLETRQAELDAQLKAAEAHREDALKSVNRVKTLNSKGYQPTATLLHAERDYKVSLNEVEAAQKRLEGNKIELDAARKGLFVGDSYNDLPRSAQRLDELEQSIADLTGEIEQRQARVAHLTAEIADETKLFSSRSAANVIATVDGRIWETLTANGEEVRTGQDLLRVIDCGSATVTATVSEPIYNTLWIGQPVEFRLHGERRKYTGSVAALTGLAPAGSNFAIKQTALKREPYHVTIAVPELAMQQRCNVGRSGQVSFDTSSKASDPTPAVRQPEAPASPKISGNETPSVPVAMAINFAGSMRSALESFAASLAHP